MKKVLTIIIALSAFNFCFGQKYFKPVNGGVANAKTGKDYYLVDLKGKDSTQIYNALMVMVKKVFSGSEDKIIETQKNNYIKAYGVVKRGITSFYDLKFNTEFKIKNGRYVFLINNINLETDESNTGKRHRLLIKQGSNFSTPDDYTDYLLRIKDVNKPTFKHKDSYKALIKKLDVLGSYFDISNSYEKYAKKAEDNESGW